MSPLFKKTQKEELNLIFHIGNGSVSGALVKITHGSAPHVIFNSKIQTAFLKNPLSDRLMRSMQTSLNRVCENIIKDSYLHAKKVSRSIKHIYYVYSSPWIHSQTKIIVVNNEKNSVVDTNFIANIIEKEEKKMDEHVSDNNTEHVLIEKKVTHIKLNGYLTSKPEGKKARTVEIPFFTSTVPEIIHTEVSHTVARHFNVRASGSHSSSLLTFAALRNIFHSVNDFIAIDVGAELSEITLVKGGIILQTITIPMGTNTLVRRVSHIIDTPHEATESLLNIYKEGKSETSLSNRLDPAIMKAKEEWSRLFSEGLRNAKEEMMIPKNIFLIVGNKIGKYFHDFMKEEKMSELQTVSEPFVIVNVDAKLLSDFCLYDTKIPQETSTSLYSVALNSLSAID